MDITSLINQILEQLGLGSLDKPENVTQVALRLLTILAILLAAYIVARILQPHGGARHPHQRRPAHHSVTDSRRLLRCPRAWLVTR
jgi:hypothetical protein